LGLGGRVTGDGRKFHDEELHDVYFKYYSGDQVKESEMDAACGTYGGEERCIQEFGGET
jgi:hypothetical protein